MKRCYNSGGHMRESDMTLKGHFDGTVVVLDEPPPQQWKPNQPVEVRLRAEAVQPEPTGADQETVLMKLAKLAGDFGFPPDFSEQHDHYLYGTPKR